jgi:hypothetical protein
MVLSFNVLLIFQHSPHVLYLQGNYLTHATNIIVLNIAWPLVNLNQCYVGLHWCLNRCD